MLGPSAVGEPLFEGDKVPQPIFSEVDNLLHELRLLRAQVNQVVSEKLLPIAKPPPEREVPMKVHVKMLIRRVFNLDTSAQTFGVQLCFEMSWKCPVSELLPKPEDDDGAWAPNWTPKYRIRKIMAESIHTSNYSIKMVNGEAWIVAQYEHLIEVYEHLDLHTFPMDHQSLNIEIISIPNIKNVWWLSENPSNLVSMDIKRVQLADFAVVRKCPLLNELKLELEGGDTCSAVKASVQVMRRSTYYILNVTALLALIVSGTLCAFALHPADIGGRLSIDFCLFLTVIMFKLFLQFLLPKLNYMTLLDIYVLGGFVMVAAVIVSHATLPHRYITQFDNSPLHFKPDFEPREDTLIKADKISLYVLCAVWGLFTVVWFTFAFGYSRAVQGRMLTKAVKQKERKGSVISVDLPNES